MLAHLKFWNLKTDLSNTQLKSHIEKTLFEDLIDDCKKNASKVAIKIDDLNFQIYISAQDPACLQDLIDDEYIYNLENDGAKFEFST